MYDPFRYMLQRVRGIGVVFSEKIVIYVKNIVQSTKK